MADSTRNGYEDVAEIEDPDGVIAVISRRRSNGALSVAFFKRFERDGVKEKTNFLNPAHFPGLRRVLALVEKRIATLAPIAAEARPR